MNGYGLLGLAIACEIFSISMLKAAAGFSKLIPSLAFIAGMGASFYIFSQALAVIPLIAYAVWSGLGTVLTVLVGILIWKEYCNIYTGVGIALIIIGVVLVNLKDSARKPS